MSRFSNSITALINQSCYLNIKNCISHSMAHFRIASKVKSIHKCVKIVLMKRINNALTWYSEKQNA